MSNRTPDPQSRLAREVIAPLRNERALARTPRVLFAAFAVPKRKPASLLPELVERARKAAH